MVAGFLFVSFLNTCRAKALMGSDCAVGNDLSDHSVIRGIATMLLVEKMQSSPLPAVKTPVYPQPCAQLCINRVDGCLLRWPDCIKTDLTD